MVFATTFSGVAGASGNSLNRYRTQQLTWHACEGTPAPIQCASVTVPRDWRRPGTGSDMRVEVSRIKSANPAARRGVMFVVSGGPGSTLVPLQYTGLKPVADAYDLIGLELRHDPRKRIDCQNAAEYADSLRIDVLDRSRKNIRSMLDYSRKIAERCVERSGDQVRHITTEQTVKDTDLVRTLLGENKISYLGVSAGPWLGAHYATTYPDRVDRVLFDGSVDFTTTWYHAFNLAPPAFEQRFIDFLGWLARYDSVYGYGDTVESARTTWEARRAHLVDHPLKVSDKFTLTAGNLDNGSIGSLYLSAQFPDFARALGVVEHFDAATPEDKQLVERVFGPSPYFDPAPVGAFYSLMCNDTPWPRGGQHYVDLSDDLGAKYPFMGYGWLLQPCAYWPYRSNAQQPVTGKGLPPILMINSTNDPAAPYAGALHAHQGLKHSRMVTVTGSGDHGQFGFGNECVDRIGVRFLVDGQVPAGDLTCQGLPEPVPTGGTANG